MFSQYENVIEKDDGVYIRAGKFAGTYKNFCYLIENTETKEKYYKMTCNPDNTKCTILSIEDMELIINHIDQCFHCIQMDILLEKNQIQKNKFIYIHSLLKT